MPSKSKQPATSAPKKRLGTPAMLDSGAGNPLLNGLSINQFLYKHWHKKPLLIRQALSVAELTALQCDRERLLTLGQQEGVESRLIVAEGKQWQFTAQPSALPPLTQRQWTLLVQGMNLHHPPIAALLRRFRFLPDVRLDDIMVSYATDGGGVGPHFDSYDVFLLQLEGVRRWQISAQKDLTLKPNLPLKILQNFTVEDEWCLEPGDMLYLPPRYAHNGIAQGECITLSVGFRAPAFNELAQQFYTWLAEQLDIPGAVHDANLLTETAEPARIPGWLVEQFTQALRKAAPTAEDIQAFVGEYFSEPKATTFFSAPAKSLNLSQFKQRLQRDGLALSARSRLLYDADNIYFNGQSLYASGIERKLLTRLANQHTLSPTELVSVLTLPDFMAQLHDWYLSGWLLLGEGQESLAP
ncbi:JmjC domain-containing protein [Parvibium lacunae]|uniref:Cupin domain-containing protein n=1 Tax=Parvibium lacunae TaxID=1888893 RepID=A0A368L760_9BURK|nr:cupin domain-containing protein [Parvibium lacunae]RCS59528.1 cupin domain-containing protein [Parvibium lacunae]